jgi:sugar (pentulose or hexulose) kinase
MTNVTAIFDIGKTNKKLILFDAGLKPVYRTEVCFPEIRDESGFPCDDIESITRWMTDTLRSVAASGKYSITALNFSTYGATLVYLDEYGKLLTPLYNYLKPMPAGIAEEVYNNYGGMEEFSRQTASPALGFLNSGLQSLWLKKTRPEVFSKVKTILHFPQYLSFLFSGKLLSEYTSIGCHTAMWDFDRMEYHKWMRDEGIHLPEPVANNIVFQSEYPEFQFNIGTGIHDSSSSLAPFILASRDKFLLLSTGTWCINMNPFNYEPLTREQLRNDCLCYMSINQKPVKSSRLFMGHIHDVNLERLIGHFNAGKDDFKRVNPDKQLLENSKTGKTVFFSRETDTYYTDRNADLSRFRNFDEAYHRMVTDLADLNARAIEHILPKNSDIRQIYITGGFAKNEIFTRYTARIFSDKKVFTSDFDNSSALGAALMVNSKGNSAIDLGLKEVAPLF